MLQLPYRVTGRGGAGLLGWQGGAQLRKRFANAIKKHPRPTHGLRRSPTRANFQKSPRNLAPGGSGWQRARQQRQQRRWRD